LRPTVIPAPPKCATCARTDRSPGEALRSPAPTAPAT
jgi:hypothetical protein